MQRRGSRGDGNGSVRGNASPVGVNSFSGVQARSRATAPAPSKRSRIQTSFHPHPNGQQGDSDPRITLKQHSDVLRLRRSDIEATVILRVHRWRGTRYRGRNDKGRLTGGHQHRCLSGPSSRDPEFPRRSLVAAGMDQIKRQVQRHLTTVCLSFLRAKAKLQSTQAAPWMRTAPQLMAADSF